MSNVAIYYSMNWQEKKEEAIEKIELLIHKITDEVKGVYIDAPGSSENFNLLTSQDLNKLQILYINREPENDFDAQMINELAKATEFKVVYFHEI